jgi:hypothetical protein
MWSRVEDPNQVVLLTSASAYDRQSSFLGLLDVWTSGRQYATSCSLDEADLLHTLFLRGDPELVLPSSRSFLGG